MENIMDYLDWRGDLKFSADGINEIDNLIFSELIYMNFDGLREKINGNSLKLSEAGEYFRGIDRETAVYGNSLFKGLPDFIEKVSLTQRFCDVKLTYYENVVEPETALQFAAMLFTFEKDRHFLAFRGTDNTIAGWKEDFMMAYMSEVPAQRMAVKYINRIMEAVPGEFYVGGHSKGGNLAVYAAVNSKTKFRSRILGVYNNDGPGFLPDIIKSEKYQSLLPRIITLVPKASVVGMLLEHEEEYKVVNSSSFGGISQHDAFSWEVKGKGFVYVNELTKGSLNVDSTIRRWLDGLTFEKRAEFVNALFGILEGTGAITIDQLTNDKTIKIDTFFKAYSNLDKTMQTNLLETIDLFFQMGQKTIIDSLNQEIKEKLPGKKQRYIKIR